MPAAAEVVIEIRHYLMGRRGAPLSEIREVRSHPVALAQCRRFLAQHPGMRAVAVHDTAGAAREVARQDSPSLAAIAPRGAAARYGLDVLASDVQDRRDNQTRFFLMYPQGKEGPASPLDGGALKTTIIAETDNRPGALHALLGVFARRGTDLTFIDLTWTNLPHRAGGATSVGWILGEMKSQVAELQGGS